MKNASQCAKRLSTLLKKIADAPVEQPEASQDPIEVLVYSFLLWESTQSKAAAAYKSIVESVVDFNDLRVCMPQEILEIIGPRYPRGLDRCQRIRAVLRDVYCREHAVNLDRLGSKNKRDVRKYLDSLEGIVPYVASRVMLIAFGAHAMPVDDQLRTQLIEAGAADTSAENAELSTWLERQIKASDAVTAHHALQAWVDEQATKPRSTRSRAAGKKTTSRKAASSNGAATKKKTTKKRAKTKKKLSKA